MYIQVCVRAWSTRRCTYKFGAHPHADDLLQCGARKARKTALPSYVSSSSYDMYPPPHMTCILLIIISALGNNSGTYQPQSTCRSEIINTRALR